MSTIIDRPAALVASPRPRLLDGSRDLVIATCPTGALVADTQPRLMDRLPLIAAAAWRHQDAPSMRAFDVDEQGTTAGRNADFGGAYGTSVTTTVFTTKQHSIRSGPPTRRP